ncbi:hypothetical protein BD779DRAFT_1475093 [Infundibulicybe gibba]|nr:hypothetical protein BD779DRAFT_1475093 [Infundibulicybe gibba]
MIPATRPTAQKHWGADIKSTKQNHFRRASDPTVRPGFPLPYDRGRPSYTSTNAPYPPRHSSLPQPEVAILGPGLGYTPIGAESLEAWNESLVEPTDDEWMKSIDEWRREVDDTWGRAWDERARDEKLRAEQRTRDDMFWAVQRARDDLLKKAQADRTPHLDVRIKAVLADMERAAQERRAGGRAWDQNLRTVKRARDEELRQAEARRHMVPPLRVKLPRSMGRVPTEFLLAPPSRERGYSQQPQPYFY